MLSAERPDAVVMAVPPAVACAAACPVLERGFPLLLEKPPGLTAAELDRLVAAAGRGGGRAQVAFNRRHMPVMQRALEILAGAFRRGSVERIDYDMIRHERWDPDFSTTAIHAIDAALVLARAPFRSAEIRYQALRRGDLEAADVDIEARCSPGPRVLVRIRPVSGGTRSPRPCGPPAGRWSCGSRSRRSPRATAAPSTGATGSSSPRSPTANSAPWAGSASSARPGRSSAPCAPAGRSPRGSRTAASRWRSWRRSAPAARGRSISSRADGPRPLACTP